MRIGIDARCLSRELTGIGYYCLNVIKELDKNGIESVLFSPAPIRIQNANLKYGTVVQRNYKSSIIRQLWSEFCLPLIVKQYGLDLFWGPSHRLPLFLQKKMASVLTIHDLTWRIVPRTMRKSTLLLEAMLMPPSLRKADLILVDSLSTVSDLNARYQLVRHKLRHITLASEFFHSKNFAGQPEPVLSMEHYLLFVGSIEPRKNLNQLLTAYATLPNELKNKFKLVVVGGKGWGRVNLEEQIMKLSLQDNVVLRGYVKEQELIYLYKQAYCLVMPSLYEGFGLPILEAQAFGVPVVTSNTSSMPEVAGEGAILVDPYSVESIREGLKKLLTNDTLRQELSTKAIENAKKYSWEKTAQLTLEVFKEALVIKRETRHD